MRVLILNAHNQLELLEIKYVLLDTNSRYSSLTFHMNIDVWNRIYFKNVNRAKSIMNTLLKNGYMDLSNYYAFAENDYLKNYQETKVEIYREGSYTIEEFLDEQENLIRKYSGEQE